MRAGETDARIPLDEIRNRLDRLGRPNFRISCREADWLGPNDRQNLEAVSQDSTIRVLLLNELGMQAVRELLAEEIGVDNADAFKNEAERRGLGAMLRNPQTLKLLTKAVGPVGTWPDSRLETLELACRQLATEYHDEHRHGGPNHRAEIILAVLVRSTWEMMAERAVRGATKRTNWRRPSPKAVARPGNAICTMVGLCGRRIKRSGLGAHPCGVRRDSRSDWGNAGCLPFRDGRGRAH